MVRMVNSYGQEFNCDEDIARGFEARGVAKRVAKKDPKAEPKARPGAGSLPERYAAVSSFVEGGEGEYAHLADAVVEMATAGIARRVIAAGAKARGETAAPGPSGVALQIINAGKKARGEQ